MIIDMHIHQNQHSLDSKLNIYEGIEYAKKNGLDGICITDHDNLGLRKLAKDLSYSSGIQIFVGVEIFTTDGDMLCYGIDEIPKERLSAQETIDFVNHRGGVCIAAHPFRKNGRGIENRLSSLEGLVAIEGYNGRTKLENNLRSVSIANELGIPITGGSDAHTVEEIGNYITKFEKHIYSEETFLQELKAGRFSAGTIRKDNEFVKGIA